MACVYLEPPTISSNPGSLGFPGCALLALVRPVPPTLAPSLQRSRSVPWPVVLDVQSCTPLVLFRAGDVAALRQVRHRQISTVTRFQAHPCTGHKVLALVRPVVSYSLALSSKRAWPVKLLAGLLSFVPSPTLFHKFQVTPKFPNFQNPTAPYRCALSLQKSSVRSTSVMENL